VYLLNQYSRQRIVLWVSFFPPPGCLFVLSGTFLPKVSLLRLLFPGILPPLLHCLFDRGERAARSPLCFPSLFLAPSTFEDSSFRPPLCELTLNCLHKALHKILSYLSPTLTPLAGDTESLNPLVTFFPCDGAVGFLYS